jgi:hypothetical protein
MIFKVRYREGSMLHSRISRSNTIGIVLGALAVFGASAMAQAATNDCERLDVTTVASILSVPKARANPSAGHHKQPPDNMDVLGCSYVEASPNPLAKVLMYNVYTPLPKNLPSMFASLSHPNVFGQPPQAFSPGVGIESTGWVRPSVNGETFDGSIVFRMPSYIMDVKVSGMPSLDATKKALVNAGKALAKP